MQRLQCAVKLISTQIEKDVGWSMCWGTGSGPVYIGILGISNTCRVPLILLQGIQNETKNMVNTRNKYSDHAILLSRQKWIPHVWQFRTITTKKSALYTIITSRITQCDLTYPDTSDHLIYNDLFNKAILEGVKDIQAHVGKKSLYLQPDGNNSYSINKT